MASIGHKYKIYLEIVKTHRQTSLGNVNICHTIIISCDHPRIEEPHKAKKRQVSLLFSCRCSHVLIYIAAFFVLRQKDCFIQIMTSCFITCSLFQKTKCIYTFKLFYFTTQILHLGFLYLGFCILTYCISSGYPQT